MQAMGLMLDVCILNAVNRLTDEGALLSCLIPINVHPTTQIHWETETQERKMYVASITQNKHIVTPIRIASNILFHILFHVLFIHRNMGEVDR